MIPGNTLILFDEIQECPNARTAIKFLVEDGRFDYIETGSLLGVKNKVVRSLPVGFEELYTMYPMDFEEFILANGVQRTTIDTMREAYNARMPVSDVIHTTLRKLFYVRDCIIKVKNGIARVRSESAVYCPDCGMKLLFHGTCKRKVREQEKTRCYVLRVLFCKSCKALWKII